MLLIHHHIYSKNDGIGIEVWITQHPPETNTYLTFPGSIAVHQSVIAFIIGSAHLIRLKLKYWKTGLQFLLTYSFSSSQLHAHQAILDCFFYILAGKLTTIIGIQSCDHLTLDIL